MCILFWTLDNHPKYKFIFAANRDEYLNRPTSSATWWHPNILSGIDLLKSGTWLGINRYGKFAALTNYREDFPPMNLLSRGAVVRSILESDESLYEQLKSILNRSEEYGGFNLITLDLSHDNPTSYYLVNRENVGIKELNKGEIYGLSNSLLENPWPKVNIGIKEMELILKESTNESDIVDRLFNLLSKPIAVDLLETLNEEYDIWNNSIRISKYDREDGSYATRTSTVILVDHDNNVVFIEKNLFDDDEKFITNDEGQWFRFKLGDVVVDCDPGSTPNLQNCEKFR
ncbi:NRDE protein [Glomus cerebriforme]|uniref:NRDE protein n=1 Tax=Glomus cerebriforme TaxID=658196 RepID=A0A397SFN8_9GLOM|nr:NRDE protein [Glomus cerebriforme]